ncbi:host attachment family protein [Jannaschia sp. W003]|uniref:host attachment family protein n=1 Tax=Jannaschia sp. W003 TaxID=2867012 RepID=UPI0021A79CD8|nr:host attachment family protein [Jannaschia sp. W003]UWQ20509.1 host attachment family protein [Jannaschia sp. W003]
MAKLRNGTLVVVTDSEKALFLVNRTDDENPNLEVVSKREEDNPPDREQSANRRGRVGESAQPGKHAYDETDFHELQKERFASDLADRLYKMAHRGEYDHLVLVASPQVLGVVRDEMHKEVSDKLVATIDKTLTNHPLSEIEKVVVDSLHEQA